ncbi:MAG: VanW family protein, partial [Patescibacteria group bacterium]|nr:VanW family protein [Patescibacteria group bacterium]
APIKVKAKDYYSTVKKSELISWIKTGNEGAIDFDREKIKAFITKDLSSRFDQEAEEPRFKIVSGRMSFWQSGVEGRKINLEKSAEKIVQEILEKKSTEIDLELEIIPIVSMEEGDIVIKELLGTGHSNFAGSSASRKKNITVGANSVQGLLIKPGEEFSLVKQLGDVSEASGYYPELVIKGNKTVLEFGGGLCQVATTLFRSALATGLPITARQNHSYRVSYYEPAGTDAAVYIPNPDVRFINDTKNYILIQSRISGNDIYFDFWGVKDGRVASSTKPTIFNIVKPAPKKIIVSPDLKPGETKCTESAHNGADAFFDYTVTYADGQVVTKRFKSHYVPWQAVCLVGPTATSTKPIATSTPPVASSTSPTATSTTN